MSPLVPCSHAERPFADRETLRSGLPLGDDAYGSRRNSIDVDPRGAFRLNTLALSVPTVHPAGARTDTRGENRFEASVRVSAGAATTGTAPAGRFTTFAVPALHGPSLLAKNPAAARSLERLFTNSATASTLFGFDTGPREKNMCLPTV